MTEQLKENSLEDNHQSIVVIKRPYNQGPERKFLLQLIKINDQLRIVRGRPDSPVG